MKSTDVALGAFEAKNKFSELLEQVGQGVEFTITKHARPVARLVPAVSLVKGRRKKAATELRALRDRYSLKGVSVRALIDDGLR